ncbi:hypothetical protein [Dokdonella fugitiva]|jgi:hypothetical protein|uniref:Uncharacterized protein n=1 Tax=Dokdonella fugitiva TaxID=328517 RepID=A0A4R2IAD3_9GAMM|nr:hypothetical protein [Dokdonella fugitiva]MBA8883194.1 hypothetical protein [Dokdonella fugitiva]TCO40348.1 hypothetical protein EV148_105143 [Dokdonella fugitiva]
MLLGLAARPKPGSGSRRCHDSRLLLPRAAARALRVPPYSPVRFARMRDSFFRTDHMIETNPIHARIADLKDRVASLRGYL